MNCMRVPASESLRRDFKSLFRSPAHSSRKRRWHVSRLGESIWVSTGAIIPEPLCPSKTSSERQSMLLECRRCFPLNSISLPRSALRDVKISVLQRKSLRWSIEETNQTMVQAMCVPRESLFVPLIQNISRPLCDSSTSCVECFVFIQVRFCFCLALYITLLRRRLNTQSKDTNFCRTTSPTFQTPLSQLLATPNPTLSYLQDGRQTHKDRDYPPRQV